MLNLSGYIPPKPKCHYCNEPFKDDEIEVDNYYGIWHHGCAEEGTLEQKIIEDQEMKASEEAALRRAKKDNKTLEHVRRKYPHIYQCIQFENDNCIFVGEFKFVTKDQVRGNKDKPLDYFGESVKVKKMVHGVQTYWEDGFDGEVYLHVKEGLWFSYMVNG